MAALKNTLLIILLVTLLASAIAAIYTKYYSRVLFNEMRKQETILEQYDVEWGQLQLELTTFSDQSRVEVIARDQLMMTMPPKEKIVHVQP